MNTFCIYDRDCLPVSTHNYINATGINKAAIKCIATQDMHFPHTMAFLSENFLTRYALLTKLWKILTKT